MKHILRLTNMEKLIHHHIGQELNLYIYLIRLNGNNLR